LLAGAVRGRYTRRFAPPVGIGRVIQEQPTMKSGIHPEYHEINIIMTDGTQFKTRSCMGKAGDTLRLDIDPKSHPAWTGVQRIMDTGGQVAKFNKKFAGIGTKTK
jgi:large subunit ribosomal protein L31